MAKPKASLTACLIVRNEEAYLEQSLSSLHGLVDEIVVVDTGSTDQTIPIAKAHGAVLAHYRWNNDFAAARNVSLSLASSDWILYIDADESLHAKSEDLQVLDHPEAVAATVSFRPASHMTCYREYRLFRNRLDLRFRSPIHESIVPDLDAIVEAEGLHIVGSDAHIEHHGYEGDLTHKHRRNRPMLLQAVKLSPGRIYLWHALGDCELGLGDEVAAERAWRKALALVRRVPGEPQNAMIYSNLLALPKNQQRPGLDDLAELLDEASRYHQDDPLVRWWLASHALTNGQIQKCRFLLEDLLLQDRAPRQNAALAYDRRLFGANGHALMANSYLAQARYAKAEVWFDKALSFDPGNKEYKTKRDLARAQRAA
ncbi:MAG: glycosyltransferase [Congregibacter sp.]